MIGVRRGDIVNIPKQRGKSLPQEAEQLFGEFGDRKDIVSLGFDSEEKMRNIRANDAVSVHMQARKTLPSGSEQLYVGKTAVGDVTSLPLAERKERISSSGLFIGAWIPDSQAIVSNPAMLNSYDWWIFFSSGRCICDNC
jgi:hypothetical protein